MIKYSVLVLLGVAVLILGLTSPVFDPRRDPVPEVQKVAHSSHCAGCHGRDESGMSLVDGAGNDVNIHDDWQISMMGLSAHDPFWRATVAHETNIYPTAREEIETTCLKCHAPLGSIQSHLTGLPYSFEMMLGDSLGLDGVSCSSCHQQPAKNLGKGHSGNFTIDTNRVLFGPYPNPVQGPMQIYVGFDPVFSDHIYSSGVCAGCHTLITKTLDEDGIPTGDFFTEQATYHEWLNSVYPSQGKECQSCHMPFIADSVVIATDLLALDKRYPFGLHQFFGANTAMLSMMQSNKDELGLPSGSTSHAWSESIENNRISLGKAATLEILSLHVANDTLYLDLNVKNKSGHKLPSGYPSRITWVRIIMTDEISNDTIYKNGLMDAEGNIDGRNHPFEPHHEVSRSTEDVQIYEMVMSDIYGDLTTRLNGAFEPLKDNRLLPLGFRRNHSTYDTVAVWGNAASDPQYDTESNKGADIIQYRIPLNGKKGLANLNVALNYHTFPSRWMNDLFSNDTVDLVVDFKEMYSGYENYVEVIDTLSVEKINLATSAIQEKDVAFSITLFPNPGDGSQVMISSSLPKVLHLYYELIDMNGMIINTGSVKDKIILPFQLKPGIYYFVFYEKSKMIAVKPYTVL